MAAIIFRRIVAVLLAVIFVPALLLTLVYYRVNGTVGSPDFYASQLRGADVYNYVHTDILPVAIDETHNQAVLVWKPVILKIARDTVPPDWLQARTEDTIRATIPYMVGDTPSFRVLVPLKDRVQALGASVKSTLGQGSARSELYSQIMPTVLAQMDGLRLPVPVNTADIAAKAFPPEWMVTQINAAVDEALPFFTGDKPHFSIQVSLADRMDAIQSALTDAFKHPLVYDYVTRQYIVTAVKQTLGQLPMPAGMTVTDADISALVAQACPLDWYQSRVPDIVAQIFAYVRGTQPTLDITLPITDRKSAITAAGVKLLDQKQEAQYNNLPACSPAQLASLLANPPKGMPPYRPEGMSYAQLKSLTGVDLASSASPLITLLIPDQFKIADPSLTTSLVQFKDLMQKGFTYTDQDLVKSLGAAGSGLPGLRQTASTGFVFTDADLRSQLGTGKLDTIRGYIDTFRKQRFYVWIIPLLLLAAIAFLGGRRLGGKLAWAGGALTAGAAITLIFVGMVPGLVQPQFTGGLAGMAPSDPLGSVLSAKVMVMVQNALASFADGLRTQAVALLAIGLVAIAVGVFLDMRRKQTENTGDSSPGNGPGRD